MLKLINLIIKRTVDRIMDVFNSSHKLDDVMEDAATRITNRITDGDVLRKLAENLSESEIAEQIDLSELAQNIELSDLAGEIDVGDIAERIEVSDIAASIDMDDLARSIDYDKLAGRMDLAEVTKQAAAMVAERSESPAPEAGLSDPSLVERLLDRAVTKLLEMAEEAVANEEV